MSSLALASQDKALEIGPTILKLVGTQGSETFEYASHNDFIGEKGCVIFVHGFTANANYMKPLMRQFTSSGYAALAYNYPCYAGIDNAAKDLGGLLDKFNNLMGGKLAQDRIFLIGHSMGGLVARALVCLYEGYTLVQKVFTLGSPHNGALVGNKFLGYFVSWAENLSGLVYGGYSMKSRSAKQLMLTDVPNAFLDTLATAAPPPGSVDFHSFSGGLNYLTIGSNPLVQRVFNKVIQRHMKNEVNDGLVPESSSDISGQEVTILANGCAHHNNYVGYKELNHSNLCESQSIALEILSLMKEG